MPSPKLHGNLASASLPAAANTELYKVPAGRKATALLTLCNTTGADIAVRCAHVPGGIGALSSAHWRWYDLPVPKFAEKAGIPMAANAAIVIWAAQAGISAAVDGVEEDA